MPILWLLLVAILAWRWSRIRAGLILVATTLLLLASIPVTSDLLRAPLVGARSFEAGTMRPAATIVVPTGGIYDDGNGTWRATQQSVRRAVAAQRLQKQLALPLVVAGGAPLADQPAESVVVARELNLSGDVVLEQTARNSDETGAALSALIPDVRRCVILVTSSLHVARMSAVLRHHGFEVLVFPVGSYADPNRITPLDFLPQYRGFNQTRTALREYIAIGWYLLSGKLAWTDLEEAPDQRVLPLASSGIDQASCYDWAERRPKPDPDRQD